MNRFESFNHRITLIAIVIFLSITHYGITTNREFTEIDAFVEKVIDGDTFEVRFDDGRQNLIRLWGIDTPESYVKRYGYEEFLGKEAYEFVRNLITRKNIKLKLRLSNSDFMRDKYGRILAFAYFNNYDIASLLLEKGFAKVYRKNNSPNHNRYIALENTAREKQLGIWNKIAEKEFYRKQFLLNKNRYLILWFWENDRDFLKKIVCDNFN